MNAIDFTFSDLIAGYIHGVDLTGGTFSLRTSDERDFQATLTSTVYAEVVRNLGESFQNATDQIPQMLTEGRYAFVYGTFYPDGPHATCTFEAKRIVFLDRDPQEFRFEQQDWWINQIRHLADFYLKSEFGDGPIDFVNYRTNLSDMGAKGTNPRQETDTISRLVYGFASAYLMTGEDRYLEAAEKGTEYLRQHHRFEDKQGDVTYWYHAVDLLEDGTRHKIFASEFGDDYHAIPAYEQIYALAGPVQTYRITGDQRILSDAQATIRMFNKYYRDSSEHGGYYSHIDPVSLSPHSESLGHNKSKKNWNSVGDHAPAYLINLYLATGEKTHAEFLEYTFDTIAAHFPDYDESPFVQERFFDNWTKDQTWGWQKNRAVVGHNLKIAWNLMRMNSLVAKPSYTNLAQKIANVMPAAGSDQQRGGWYDVVERVTPPGQRFHRFVWHDRKAWWQQEQAILAYQILSGTLKSPKYLRLARESAAFYNAFFLDVEAGGVYFNVLANGLPYALGTERGKGSHSMAGYHSFELAYLAGVYTNLLIRQQPMDFYFRPVAGALPNHTLRVSPDLLPEGSVQIGRVWINGRVHEDFDAYKLTVKLPETGGALKVRVQLVPTGVRFTADLLEVTGGCATISLGGILDEAEVSKLLARIDSAVQQGIHSISFHAQELESISPGALRALIFRKQQLGADFNITVQGASDEVIQAVQESGLGDEIRLTELAIA